MHQRVVKVQKISADQLNLPDRLGAKLAVSGDFQSDIADRIQRDDTEIILRPR